MSRFDHGDGRRSTAEDQLAGRSRTIGLATIAALVLVAGVAAACSSSSTSSTTTTTSSTSTTSKGLSAATVRYLQAGLSKVGCYAGKVDGVSGPMTVNALTEFQRAVGIPADGVYGAQTKAKLIAAETVGRKVCTTSTTTTTGSSTTTTSAGATVPPAATGAITTYETANGPAAGTWVIASSKVATADPIYVYFRIGPAPGHESTVQGGYGFVHSQGGTWTVTGFGTSEVGCPPASAQNQLVPPSVLSEFGVSCPST